MGAAISALRDQILGADDKAKEDILQQLLFLVNAANGKLDNYQNEMEQQFRNREKVSETSIVGMRAMRWERGYRVGVTKQANNGINEIVDAFFGDKNDDKKESSILAGFKASFHSVPDFLKVISTALDVILGNTMAGEQEEIKWFVFAHHNAIIRVDVRLWRYNFIGKGVMAQAENVFCYVFCTSVVDHKALKVDELVYLLSEHGGDENVEAYLGYLLNIWSKLEAIAKDPTKNPFTTQGLPKIERKVIKTPDTVAVKFVEAAKAHKEETPEKREEREREERIERAKVKAARDMESKVKKAIEEAAEKEEQEIIREEEEEAQVKQKAEEEKKKQEDAAKKKPEAGGKTPGEAKKNDSNNNKVS